MKNVRNVVGNECVLSENERGYQNADRVKPHDIASAYADQHSIWLIRDMKPGEIGYTVPWAYTGTSLTLNPSFEIHRFRFYCGDTLRLIVKCVKVGLYDIEYKSGDEEAFTWETMTDEQRQGFGLEKGTDEL
jgi:hypothetical protein